MWMSPPEGRGCGVELGGGVTAGGGAGAALPEA